MARELRHETLQFSGITAPVDANTEFRNDSSVMIHIRDITINAHSPDLVAADECWIEVSKQPSFSSRTNNNTSFAMLAIIVPRAGINTVVVAKEVRAKDKWARGQLTLEPGEGLFTNVLHLSGNGAVDMSVQIQYEFQ